ncbi:hypothetical protein ACFLT7_01445 [candidate division KSB1 bacterium]
MKIGFDLHYDETPLFIEIGKYLSDTYQAEISGVSLGKRWSRQLEGQKFISIENVSEFFQQIWERETDIDSHLAEYERKYNISNLSSFILADRYLVKKPYDFCRRYLLAMFRFWEHYFEQARPDVFLGPGVQSVFHLVCFHVARKNGAHYFNFYGARYPHERFAIAVDNIYEQWTRVNDLYREYLGRELKPEERNKAQTFLDDFRRRGTGPDFYRISPRHRPKLSFYHLRLFWERLRNYYLDGWGRDQIDILSKSPFWYARRDLRRILLAPIHSRTYFEKPRDDEKFIFYPLHFQPEANTLIMAPYLVNQIAVVDNIAKSLPVNYRLYVKEHFGSIGYRKGSYYNEIKAIPNVRLIDPFANSHDLIRRAEITITIGSTAGWEALLYNKPVIHLGRSFYGASNLCYRIDNFSELPSVIKKIEDDYQPDEEKLIRFIAALLNGTYPGRPALPHVDPAIMRPDNIKLFAEGIYDEFNRLK